MSLSPQILMAPVVVGQTIRPPFLQGLAYNLTPFAASQNAGGAVANQLYFTPIRTPGGAPITALGGSVITAGGAGSLAKWGVWLGDSTTRRPVGTPLAWSDTPVATDSGPGIVYSALVEPFAHVGGVLYFVGWAQFVATTAPTWLGPLASSTSETWEMGEVGPTNNTQPRGVRTSFPTFTNSLGTFDATSATWTLVTTIQFPTPLATT